MFGFLKGWIGNRYSSHPDAVVISCYFNPQNSVYRKKAFDIFYKSIKHMEHRIVECVIGNTKPHLKESKYVSHVYTQSLLWHKESILNQMVKKLPKKYKFVFWIDADVIFENKDWMIDGVMDLHFANIIQPFSVCVHLMKGQLKPDFDIHEVIHRDSLNPHSLNDRVWNSFGKMHQLGLSNNENYNVHGHVGFAWGIRREILDNIELYDHALIGGADHIIAHAAAGHIPHKCIQKSFTDNLDEVYDWSKKFYDLVKGKVSYSTGILYHIWHGDINKREYLKRIQEFTPANKHITTKDKNGFYVANHRDERYVREYFKRREDNVDDGFLESLAIGYMTGVPIGRNLSGAILGVALHPHDDTVTPVTGGGGASGSFEKIDDVESIPDISVIQWGMDIGHGKDHSVEQVVHINIENTSPDVHHEVDHHSTMNDINIPIHDSKDNFS